MLVQKLVKEIGTNLAAHYVGAQGAHGTLVERHCPRVWTLFMD